MRPLGAIVLLVPLLAGCGKGDPAAVLRDALAKTAAVPHSTTGTATRTLTSGSVAGASAKWQISTAYQGPFAQVDLKGSVGSRRSYGREGWWVEEYDSLWRPCQPPAEAIEWLDPAGLSPTWGPGQTIEGREHLRIEAKHPAGTFWFDIDPGTGRIARAQGMASDGNDTYDFEVRFDYKPVTVAPPAETRTVLEALGGRRADGDDAEARALIAKAWEAIPTTPCTIATLQAEFLNAAEYKRRVGYLEQAPPLRAWNFSESGRQAFIFTDGTRAVVAGSLDEIPKEASSVPSAAVDEAPKLVRRAVFVEEQPSRGAKHRVYHAELADERPEAKGATCWLWIDADGNLSRQLLVGKATDPAQPGFEMTVVVDFVFTRNRPGSEMVLLNRAREIFRR